MSRLLTLFALLLGLIATGATRPAQATIRYDFTFFGKDAAYQANGGGYFVVEDKPSAGLGDLTDFFLDLSVTGDLNPIVPNFIYGLIDVVSFSASILPDHSLTALSLETKAVAQANGSAFAPQVFWVTGLGPNGAGISPYTASPDYQIGAISIALPPGPPLPAPEPGSLALFSLGLLAIPAVRRKRKG